MYVCVHIHTLRKQELMKKEAMSSKEQGRIYGRVWRDEREWGNDVIILSKT